MDPVLDNAPCGFLTTDDEGVVLAANATLGRLLGVHPQALTGRRMHDLLSPGARIFHATHLLPLARMQGQVQEMLLGLQDGDDGEVPVLCSASRVQRNAVWVVDYVFMPARERRRFENELMEARRRAEAAVEARERFLATVSHEFRTPLNAIIGFADLLHSGYSGPLTSEQTQQVGYVLDAGRYLGTLVEDILGFTRMGGTPPELYPETLLLHDVIARSERLVRGEIRRKGIRFEGDGGCDTVTIHADPNRTQQILVNLLSNAVKFTDPAGRVWWSCTVRDNYVDIHISDSGKGIAFEDQQRIFEAFVQLGREEMRSSHRGVGLGLAISRELALAMEGDLRVESAPGNGSTFTLTLPRGSD